MRHYSLWLEKYGRRREQILDKLRNYRKQVELVGSRIADSSMILPLPKEGEDCRGRMCFVDGGEGIREMLGAAVFFIRASGLILSSSQEYLVRDLDVNVIEYDEHTKERVELLREGMEFDVAIKCVQDHKPEYVFLDGSLYVKSRRKPIECDEYAIYRKKFIRLLKLCKKTKTHVLGVSEDSKSKLLANHISTKYGIKFPKFMTDSSILRMMAGNKAYRTIQFTPESRFAADDQIDASLTASFPTVYIQPTELANPLRVDVPDWEQSFEKIIRIIIALSKGSRQYGYPLPLYLAHLDAKIEEKQAKWSAMQIINYISKNDPELYDAILRGNRRSARPN